MEDAAASDASVDATTNVDDLFSLVIGRGGQLGVELTPRELPSTVQVSQK